MAYNYLFFVCVAQVKNWFEYSESVIKKGSDFYEGYM